MKVKQNFLYKFIRNLIKNKKLLSQKKKNMNKFHKKMIGMKILIN